MGRSASGTKYPEIFGTGDGEVKGQPYFHHFSRTYDLAQPPYDRGRADCKKISGDTGNAEKKRAREQTLALLAKVGINPPERRIVQYPFELSGGLQQRVMIAMAIACSPELLIADEPTTALDVTIQAQILELLQTLQKDLGLSILLITHNFGIVAEMCDRVSVMYAGRVVETAKTRSIFQSALHPYSEALIDSIPRTGIQEKYLPTIPWKPSGIIRKNRGVRFCS